MHNKRILTLVITHNPNNPQIVGRLKQDIKFLNNSTEMKSIMDKTTLIVSQCQPKKLKHKLMQAELKSRAPNTTVSRCNMCNYIITRNSINLGYQDVNGLQGKKCDLSDVMYQMWMLSY